jgi:hypothetical protein
LRFVRSVGTTGSFCSPRHWLSAQYGTDDVSAIYDRAFAPSLAHADADTLMPEEGILAR